MEKKKKAFQEWRFVIKWSFKTPLYACMLVWKPGDIPFQPNISAVCTTQDAQSLFKCVLLAYFKGCHRNNNKRPVVETASFPSQQKKKKIRSLWAWNIVRFEPAQIISFMLKFKEMRNILLEKTEVILHLPPSPTTVLERLHVSHPLLAGGPVLSATPTPLYWLALFFFFFSQFVKMLKSALCDLWRNLKRLVS